MYIKINRESANFLVRRVSKHCTPMQARGRDEEEDDNDWVSEQIRKGVGGGAAVSRPAAAVAASEASRRPLGLRASVDATAYSGDAALKSLQQSLSRLKVPSSSHG